MNVPPLGSFPIYPYVPHQACEGAMWEVRITNHPLPHYVALYKTEQEAREHAEVLNNSYRQQKRQSDNLMRHTNKRRRTTNLLNSPAFVPEVDVFSRLWTALKAIVRPLRRTEVAQDKVDPASHQHSRT